MQKIKVFLVSPLFIYILKCLIGLSIGYTLYIYFPGHQFYWSMITVLLVIAPDDADAKRLTLERIKATSIGSIIGVLLSLFHTPNLILICAGVIITILICWYFKLVTVTRMALATLIIVMINKNQDAPWHAGLERMGCVFVGCLIGFILTLIFSGKLKKLE